MNMLSSKSAEQKNTATTKSKSKTNNDVMTDEESAEAKQAQTANDFDSDIPF